MNRIKAIIITLIVFTGLINLIDLFIKKPEIINLNNGKVELIGHAGSGFAYLINPWNPLPPNSLASIERAFLNGAQGIEVDVQVSADSVLILYHDRELDTKTNLSGFMQSKKANEILSANYVLGFPYDYFQDEKIISLGMLENALIKKKTYKLYLDIKLLNVSERDSELDLNSMKNALIIFLKNTGIPHSNITVISGSGKLLDDLKNEMADIQYSYDCGSLFREAIESIQITGYKSLCISNKEATKKLVQLAHKEGIEVILYGGKSKFGLRKMLELNPDVVQVNNVKAMYRLLN